MQIINTNKKAFTLLEILLVVILIGILITILSVAINPNRQLAQARNLNRKSDITTIYNSLQYQRAKNKGVILNTITTSYQEICDTGTRSITDTLPDANYCNGKLDLRVLVPTYITSIYKDNQATGTGNTGYEVAKTSTNLISIRAKNAELGEIIIINPLTVASAPSCPIGYIPVPGNILYGTSNFCVMKYEAKTGSATVVATTQATGTPQVDISQTDAITACGLNGANYGLITNAEWMTIARNIEGQNSNWYNPTPNPVNQVGSGGLWRGHSDNSPATALAANTNDSQGYEGTGNNINNEWQEKRTHTLSNGEVIWDISGNVWEWTNDTILGKDQPTGSIPGFDWRELTAITNYGTLSYNLTRPSNNTWNSTHNMGQIKSDGTSTNNTSFAFVRSGAWDATTSAGVFSLSLFDVPYITRNYIGFRCVVR